jgi:polyisoprenoid-binding protein YceI
MKKIILCITATLLLNITSFSQEKLNINIKKSTIKWIGELTFNFGGHNGFILFKEGFFIKKNDVIIGGEFIIDMNSMTNQDIKEKEGKESLIKHLKEPDFFDVKKFPLAKLTITSIEYFEDKSMRIYANLTIKGISKPIRFNATPNYYEKSLTTRFKIDRKDWNVNYKSKFKNSAISDGIGFEILIKL